MKDTRYTYWKITVTSHGRQFASVLIDYKMNYLKDLVKELKGKNQEDKRTNGIMIAKEQAILKDLIEKEKKCRKCSRTAGLGLDHIIPLDFLRSFIDVKREILEGNYQLL